MKISKKYRKSRNPFYKKGLSHIEVILSFAIFLGFLIFLLVLLNPLKATLNKQDYLNMLERGIENYTSIEVSFSTLSLSHQIDKCFYFDYDTEKVIVKNETKNLVSAFSRRKNSNKEVYINSRETFYYIYSSKEFNETALDYNACVKLNKSEYTLGFSRSYNLASYEKFNNLKKRYIYEYDKLKNELSLQDDFSFSIRDSLNNEILKAERATKKVNAVAKDFPIELAYSNGTIINALLNIKIW